MECASLQSASSDDDEDDEDDEDDKAIKQEEGEDDKAEEDLFGISCLIHLNKYKVVCNFSVTVVMVTIPFHFARRSPFAKI